MSNVYCDRSRPCLVWLHLYYSMDSTHNFLYQPLANDNQTVRDHDHSIDMNVKMHKN